ncbi:FtsW/RodA/SpoVE family cell cycle protein [Paenibacillus cremeus]|uniref:Rod shape-determining protein RodA n=1 Tax=Paenibacillus cremeus TaxID=2163881 RepID=A0A559KIL5_9BACL|nr:FtsW/RodA/SpoVE family cell cycle protein [Paenibacillus cremeus]TVY11908.1 rod shape-determining protein RodA [Paenibacillus cremeus]
MLHKFKKIDVPILGILIAFMVISTILVYSATVSDPDIHISLAKMIQIYIISFIAFITVSSVDYRFVIKGSYYMYIAGLLLLVAVLKFGKTINGAQGWFSLPMGLDFQPVELFKIILIITLATFIARRKGESLQLIRDVVPIGVIVLIPFILVVVQPDLGNAIIFIVILLGMYWIGNIRLSYVLIGVLVIGGSLYGALYLYQHFQEPIVTFLKAHHVPNHWIDRMNTFVNPTEASRDSKWQVMNSIRAIGSGSLSGEGYLKGTSIHSHFIPVAYTDAIFVVVGEEFGFVGASCLLLLYFVLIYRMILISIYCNNFAGSFIIIGIVSMLVFQIFQNIGMMIGIMPLTGITLPFVSYGGTSLMINMISMGLVMSIRLHDDKLLDEE